MTVARSVITASWLVLLAIWLLSAPSAKPNAGASRGWGREIGLRFVVLACMLLAARFAGVTHLRGVFRHADTTGTAASIAGAALCVIGVALAIWGRAALGRNWGMPMSRKVEPELVTRGPYAFVRHPIYAGIIGALIGSTLGVSLLWGIVLLVLGAYFVHASRREEGFMAEQFPAAYPAYRRRTKALIPFVW